MGEEDNSPESRLTRLESSVQRIEDQLIEFVKEFGEFKKRMEEMVDDHQTALYGDKGRPGLVGQSGALEELRVALKGYGKEPGLIAEIQNLTIKMGGYEEERKWLVRLIVGLVVADIVSRFIR